MAEYIGQIPNDEPEFSNEELAERARALLNMDDVDVVEESNTLAERDVYLINFGANLALTAIQGILRGASDGHLEDEVIVADIKRPLQ